ncbi:DUF86 domain-containing protein [Microcystis aeruginosa CS-573]|jgi:uncharacterized protein with HEPN domain|nr:HepT-like ribonuclease domain-containing protein [Microcystis aeruginosa]MDB9395841.1 DUF86 domain-containing protein [Microcystis aeruginosa CS-573]
MRDDTERLRDILEAIERVEKYARQGKTVFEQQELIQTWIVYHLQIIGEAARATSQEFKARYPAVPWRDASDLRNWLFSTLCDNFCLWNREMLIG